MSIASNDIILIRNLQPVMEAAKLLREHDIITVDTIREVRDRVHRSAEYWLEFYQESCPELYEIAHAVWQQTHPL